MATVRFSQSIATGASFSPNLSPYDRLGGGGGRVRVRATLSLTGTGTIAVGDILETLFVGSEMIENRAPIATERAAGSGPDNFTPGVEALGAPSDPIALTYTNTNANARIVTGIVEIDNA
jgi:hypothetical protein